VCQLETPKQRRVRVTSAGSASGPSAAPTVVCEGSEAEREPSRGTGSAAPSALAVVRRFDEWWEGAVCERGDSEGRFARRGPGSVACSAPRTIVK